MSQHNGTDHHDSDGSHDAERSWMAAVAAALLVIVIAVLAAAA